MIRLAVDIHGGDHGPAVVVPATIAFLERFPDVQVTFFGDTSQTQAWRAIGSFSNSPRLQWQHGLHVPTDDWSLRQLLHEPGAKDALARMLREHQRGDFEAVVTAADTRTLMIRGRQLLGCLPGVRRPALGAWIPAYTGPVFALDVGASVSSASTDLLQLARLGHRFLYANQYQQTPRVGLLNIGTERHKAKGRLSAVYDALADEPGLDFRGYVEPASVFQHDIDLLVTDGFSGNIMLKSMEASVDYARNRLTDMLTDHWPGRILGLAMVKLYRSQWRDMSPELQNGAPLLGLDGWVVKSHAAARVAGFEQALIQARHHVREGVPQYMYSQIR